MKCNGENVRLMKMYISHIGPKCIGPTSMGLECKKNTLSVNFFLIGIDK